MSEQATTPQQTERKGCVRNLLLVLLCCVALFGALAMGFIAAGTYQSMRQVQNVVNDPVGALVRGIGLAATPSARPDPNFIVNDITRMAKLQTAEMTLTRVVTGSAGVDSLFGLLEDDIAFVAVGDVTAGVDLSKLSEADVRASSFETVTVRLPAAELFKVSLNNDESQVIFRETGLLVEADQQLETLVRQTAEASFSADALEQGILDEAQASAEDTMRTLLISFGFENVLFIGLTDPLPDELPPPELPKGYLETPVP